MTKTGDFYHRLPVDVRDIIDIYLDDEIYIKLHLHVQDAMIRAFKGYLEISKKECISVSPRALTQGEFCRTNQSFGRTKNIRLHDEYVPSKRYTYLIHGTPFVFYVPVGEMLMIWYISCTPDRYGSVVVGVRVGEDEIRDLTATEVDIARMCKFALETDHVKGDYDGDSSSDDEEEWDWTRRDAMRKRRDQKELDEMSDDDCLNYR